MRQELELARRIDHQDRRGKISGTTMVNFKYNNGKGKRKGAKEPDNARNQDDRRENIGVGKNFGEIKRG
jgi:hypothetical protein